MDGYPGTTELDTSKLRGTELFRNVVVGRDDELHTEIGMDIAKVLQSSHPVICIASGNTFIEPYAIALEKLRETGGVAKDAMVFALDEYYPISASNPSSFRSNMEMAFLGRICEPDIGLREESVFFPNPYDYYMARGENITHLGSYDQLRLIEEYCRWFEERIDEAGGFALALIGCGLDHTSGFNFIEFHDDGREDPLGLIPHSGGVDPGSRTRVVPISKLVMRGNNVLDEWEDMWPYGVTMGNGTLSDYTERAIVLITGDMKKGLARKVVEGNDDSCRPYDILRKNMGHRTTVYVGDSAAGWLTRVAEPWRFYFSKPEPGGISDKEAVGMIDVLCRSHGVTEETGLTDEHLAKAGLYLAPSELAEKANRYISSRIVASSEDIPRGIRRLGAISPHPDDVGFAFYHPQMAFARAGAEVFQMVMLDGFDAVRMEDIERMIRERKDYMWMLDEFNEYTQQRKSTDSYPGRGMPFDSPWLGLSQEVRRHEVEEEVRRTNNALGSERVRLLWNPLPYYSGSPYVMKPEYGEIDVRVMQEAIEKAGLPEVVALTVDDDPNLNHRRVKRIFSEASAKMEYDPVTVGYCGSWAGMGLADADMLFPVTQEAFEEQREVMEAHVSQSGPEPKFPGTISASFIDRVYANITGYRIPVEVAGVYVPDEVIGYQPIRIMSDRNRLFHDFTR